MKVLSILTMTLTLFTACQANPSPSLSSEISIPSSSRQLIMVTTADWSTKDGKLQRYEKLENSWKKVGKSINIILGRNGLGWGLGLHSIPKDAKYVKREGDGKAPAGLFELGSGFGYEDFKIDFPYSVYTRTDHCVDDSRSQWYNQIINSKEVEKDYKSFEHMKLTNDLYRYGITVKHNSNQMANAGSCIFLHIRSRSGKGTAGCTAMGESEIIEILKWLKGEKKPLLLQLPIEEVEQRITDDSLK